MKPEIPLSDFVDRCAFDANVVMYDGKQSGSKLARPQFVAHLVRTFEGLLGEEAFFTWVGMTRPRPKAGVYRDAGDVPGTGGSVKSAPFYLDWNRRTPAASHPEMVFPGDRRSQNWTVDARESNAYAWAVFVRIDNRDLGKVNERFARAAVNEPTFSRWLSYGRHFEPVAVISGWLSRSEVEQYEIKRHEQDGTSRSDVGYRVVPESDLHPWPEHPRPLSPLRLEDLLFPDRDATRDAALRDMRDGLLGRRGPTWD